MLARVSGRRSYVLRGTVLGGHCESAAIHIDPASSLPDPQHRVSFGEQHDVSSWPTQILGHTPDSGLPSGKCSAAGHRSGSWRDGPLVAWAFSFILRNSMAPRGGAHYSQPYQEHRTCSWSQTP